MTILIYFELYVINSLLKSWRGNYRSKSRAPGLHFGTAFGKDFCLWFNQITYLHSIMSQVMQYFNRCKVCFHLLTPPFEKSKHTRLCNESFSQVFCNCFVISILTIAIQV